MLDAPIGSGADLFFWIVCILIGFIAALSFIDFKNTHGPSEPYHLPEDESSYWESRKHAEAVHREFPKEEVRASKDPVKSKEK
jgi:hypothetical protein